MKGSRLPAPGFRFIGVVAATLLTLATPSSIHGEGDTSRIDRLDTGVRAA
jgi:hypothetical protein